MIVICAAESEPLSSLVSGGPWKLTLREDRIPPEKTVPGGGEAAGCHLISNAGMPIRGYACHSNLRTMGCRSS